MTPEQWQRVFALVKASQGYAENQRASFLAANCPGDEEILKVAESLLVAQKQMGSFLEKSITKMFSAAQSSDQPTSPSFQEWPTLARGETLGRYVVLNLLGKGGMGIVYAAYDPELDRKVAVKLLSPDNSEHMAGTDGKARLLREAKAMARLSHVNVITVHDAGTLRDEVFVAMEYVDGPTLKQWVDAKPRKWREVVAMFVEAGRGLAAAHAAGIVHRDFKPDNVLIGKDGRPRVLDFGLARGTIPAESAQTVQIIGEGVSAQSIGPTALADGTTRAGALIGTPSYMAPEQLAGREVDTRTDQFSFCVALYQALYGELPFEADTLLERLGAIEQGRLRSPRAWAKVPRWLREVVTRGLSSNPEGRYPSMEALLNKLQRNPSRAWARIVAAASAVLLVSGTAWTFYRTQYNKRQICRGAEEKLAPVWNEAQKQAASEVFLATGLPYAADAIRGVSRIFEDYSRRWIAMYTETCEATHLRGEQSGELLDLRMSCLSQRREELKALAGIFATADGKVVERAVTAAQGLSDIQSCADVEALKAPLKPPAEIAVRAKVEEVRLRISDVWALNRAGKYSEAVLLARQAKEDAQSLAYHPLQAEALFALGATLIETGEYRESEQIVLSAALLAESSRHDELAAKAWGEATYVSSMLAKYDAAELSAKLAFSAIDRMGGSDRRRAEAFGDLAILYQRRGKYDEALEYSRRALALRERFNDPAKLAGALNNLAIVLMRQGKYDEALAQHQRALAIKEQVLGPMHPELAAGLHNIGVVLKQQEKYDEALTYYQRSLEIKERSLGSKHPAVALSLQTMGNIFVSQHKYEEALRSYQRARLINEKALGEDHPLVADNLMGLGEANLDLGQALRALPLLERALQIYDSKGVEAARAGLAKFILARVLVELKRDPKRARALAEQARGSFQKAAWAHKDLENLEEWLAKNFPH